MTTLETILHFVEETFTDNHTWMRSVLSRWEDYKKQFTESDLIGEQKYKEFATYHFPDNRMFIISSLRQYEAHLANNKVNASAILN